LYIPRIQKKRWVGKGRVPNREPKEPLGFSEYIFPELHNNRTLKVTPLNANSKFKAVHTSFFTVTIKSSLNVKQLQPAGCSTIGYKPGFREVRKTPV